MPARQYTFITIENVEQTIAGLVSDFFRDYPDPMPVYQYLDGDRGRGRLESALAQPRQTFGGQYLYRTVFDKTAALWRSLTLNHPYVDGNKRMGLTCCHLFLALNGYLLIASQEERVEKSVAIAADQPDTDLASIARWLRSNTLKTEDVVRLLDFFANEPEYLNAVLNMANEVLDATA